ncbi:hypothetical protein GQ607_000711 [Colletotrichum asianum]|uniref:Uncharacterized protein n=1 Tax=Colletotrichum asianum TaxID=702518 RepID=A0A8H3ZZE7_9PEZI|nr:hypothetical protein GQ607_000711 [Colletotrichum asianum]
MGANGCGRPVVQFGASSPLRCQQWGFLTDQDSGKGRGPVTDSRPDRRRSAAAAADAPVAALLHRTRCASESPKSGNYESGLVSLPQVAGAPGMCLVWPES